MCFTTINSDQISDEVCQAFKQAAEKFPLNFTETQC